MIELADRIAIHSHEAIERFLNAVEESLVFLSHNPQAGMRCFFDAAAIRDMRWFRVQGLDNYLVFYRLDEQTLDVVRVLHGARDWQNILRS